MAEITASRFAVLTNCTSRKLHSTAALRLPDHRQPLTFDALVKQWVGVIEQAEVRHQVKALYAGRSFSEARRVAQLLHAPLYVASAGLGLVESEQWVPAYDLTVAASGTTILPRLKQLSATTAEWWASLNRALGHGLPVSSMLMRSPETTWLVAMPGTYLSMLAPELAAMPSPDIARLRIFTSSAWLKAAPAALRGQVMPYDDRLESTRFSGTRSDFAQRALLHFVKELNGHQLDTEQAHECVRRAMSAQVVRRLPPRQRRSDDEIRSMLRAQWRAHDGASGRLLRYLRDDALVQCEQSRFKSLWHSVRTEMKDAK